MQCLPEIFAHFATAEMSKIGGGCWKFEGNVLSSWKYSPQ